MESRSLTESEASFSHMDSEISWDIEFLIHAQKGELNEKGSQPLI